MLLRVGLTVGMLLLVALRLLLCFLLRLLGARAVPGVCAVVIFLPARAGVLIHVAVMAGIHIAAGILTGISISKSAG